ncbi:MAG: DUF1761 domain-containing protein [Bacteroidia bacterium]|nr:DUF1761 domain-containing protein [Bacteroidia bacterium]NND26911.1 DUF1761 domain-containing protein [Flavobacteriaceae bacterium]MBT8277796.1 DUF1761 domain-containing protein [Bacteroidia bacterium]NNK61188.1 DUF1761 domain-containing protein [Flavobacteriaceae bacterium]NNL31787.1 DUF1761 domain-containing protein [Flavobacteriaceae bacterium]
MEEFDINWLAIIAASILPLVTGFIWYNPKVFGTVWMKESGMTMEKAQQMNPAKTYGLAVVMAFLIAFAIWPEVMTGGGPGMPHGPEGEFMTFQHGAFHGALLGVFLALPILATNALFEQKSFKYVIINAGYWIVTMALMGGIINAWT